GGPPPPGPEVLERPRANGGSPAGVPAGTRVAHKTGDSTRIWHDAGTVLATRPLEAPARKDNPRIVPDARDVTGLVRHARAGGKPGGYPVIDRLALESLEHLPGGFPVDGLTTRDRFEQREQRLRSGRVDEPLLECLRILEIAQHVHAVGSERVYAGADVLDAKPVHQQVRGEIAADRDHELAELSQRARASARPIQIPFRVVVGVQRERRAIDQTVE